MPNQVTSHNEQTLLKVMRALTAGGAMTMDEAFEAIQRLQNAGILFREPAEKEGKNGE